jgi:hypothetical protein
MLLNLGSMSSWFPVTCSGIFFYVQDPNPQFSGSSLPLIFCIRVWDLFIGGVIYLAKKIIRWWYFTCKMSENIICDGILHVNIFHYFKIPYFTCTTKFTYNEYIGPYFLSHVVLRFSLVNSLSHSYLILLGIQSSIDMNWPT